MGLGAQHITHNRCYEKFADFSAAFLTFLRDGCRETGPSIAMPYQTTSASSHPRIFGFWRERGIAAAGQRPLDGLADVRIGVVREREEQRPRRIITDRAKRHT